MTDRRAHVLLIENDRDTAALLAEVLEGEGFETLAADSRASATVHLRSPRLIVLDDAPGDRTSSVLAAALRRRGLHDVPIVLLSAAVDLENRARAIGAAAYLAKPFGIDEFAATCRRVLPQIA